MEKAYIFAALVASALTVAVSAPTASATDDLTHCSLGTECSLVNERSESRFYLGKEETSREVKCKHTVFTSTIKTGESTISLTPEYLECNAGGGLVEASVESLKCKYELVKIEDVLGEEEIKGLVPDILHTAEIVIVDSPETCVITISIPFTGCKITIKKQGPLSGVELLDEEEKEPEVFNGMLTTFNVTHIKVTASSGCPEEGSRESIYKGAIFFKNAFIL